MKEKLFNAIAESWNGPFPETYEEARRHDNGDSLSCFVRIELEEGIGWDDPNDEVIKDKAIHLLRTAQNDLEFAIMAIEEM